MTELDQRIADTKKLLETLEQEKYNKQNDLNVLELYKRGYCEGTTIEVFDYADRTFTLKAGGPQIVNRNQIWWEGYIIYKDGMWAKIIEQPPLEIESFKVEAVGGKAYINGNRYNLEELLTLSAFMKSHANQVKFISCGCYEDKYIHVPVETIDAIIRLIQTQDILEENRNKAFIPNNLVVINQSIDSPFWWYVYKKSFVYSVAQATQSDFIDIEFESGGSRNPEDYWKVNDKNGGYYGYIIAKKDCRTLNIEE